VDALTQRNLHVARTPEESKRINAVRGPGIIISSSGMAVGGRILHHLSQRVGDAKNTVLLVGYQAAGTRGRALQDGAKTLRMFGGEIPVHARVAQINGLSAHADRDETLRWLGGFSAPPRQVYLVHGEPQAAEGLAQAIRAKLNWNVRVAADGETVPLG
jgi:metallo-beta-lactamase family protein